MHQDLNLLHYTIKKATVTQTKTSLNVYNWSQIVIPSVEIHSSGRAPQCDMTINTIVKSISHYAKLFFPLLVDPPVSSCQEGVFLPRLLYPTPHDGAAFRAEAGKEMEFRVRAEASSARWDLWHPNKKQQFASGQSIWNVPVRTGPHRINDILVSGPLNLTQSRNTHDEFVIRWTPIQEDLGQHFSICFAVESVGWVSVASGLLGAILCDIAATKELDVLISKLQLASRGQISVLAQCF